MLRSLLLFSFLLISKNIFCQVAANRLPIVWEKSFGGFDDDVANDIELTLDSGYIVVGAAGANGGDVTGHHGTYPPDGWVLKLDINGNIEWQRSVGGSNSDYLTQVIVGTDSNYYCFGYSLSIDGDLYPAADYYKTWIIKLTAAGDIVWSKTYGLHDQISAGAIATSDGNFAVAKGDMVFKMDTAGNILWQKKLNNVFSIVETGSHQLVVSGGYQLDLITGDTTKLNWDSADTRGGTMKLKNGRLYISYGKFFPGLCTEGGASGSIAERIGYFNGIDGDFSFETWHWNVCPDGGRYGGEEMYPSSLSGLAILQDSSYIIVGKKPRDYFIWKSQALLNFNGQLNFYGTNDDGWITEFNAVKILPGEKELICAGFSNNNSGGDVSGTHGYSRDCWIVKLATISTSVWTGAKSTDWNDTENWDTKTIPAIGTIVIIPAGVPNFPVVNSNALCYSLQVDPSATITINQGYHLEIAGKH